MAAQRSILNSIESHAADDEIEKDLGAALSGALSVPLFHTHVENVGSELFSKA